MIKLCDLLLVVTQNALRLLLGQVATQVPYDLTRKVIQKVGMIFIGNIIEIDEARYNIVFEANLIDTTTSERQGLSTRR